MPEEWSADILTVSVNAPMFTEVELFDRRSRTLILTDLVQNIDPTARKAIMSPEVYLDRAEHYRGAKATATDSFSRHHLEAMERSYRTLAESEAALRRSSAVDARGK